MLRAHPANARVHSKKQIAKIGRTIGLVSRFGSSFDENNTILAGHGRWLAAQRSAHEN
jgi:hypothetical protein